MPTNKLLAALAPEDRDRLSPFLTTMPMRLRLVLYKQDAAIEDVYFPSSGVLSLTRTMKDGGTSEVYAIGNEGMIGASVFFGDPLSHTEALVQVAGDHAYKMPYPRFREKWGGTARFISASCYRSLPIRQIDCKREIPRVGARFNSGRLSPVSTSFSSLPAHLRALSASPLIT